MSVGMFRLLFPFMSVVVDFNVFRHFQSHHRSVPWFVPGPIHTAKSVPADLGSEDYIGPHPIALQ